MSTILDSLQKSSDQRDGINKSSIDNFNFSQPNKPSSIGVLVILIIVSIVAVIMYFGYGYLNKHDPTLQSNQAQNTLVTPQEQPIDNAAEVVSHSKLKKPNISEVKERISQLKAEKESQTKSMELTKTKVKSKLESQNITNPSKKQIQSNRQRLEKPESKQQSKQDIKLGIKPNSTSMKDQSISNLNQRAQTDSTQKHFNANTKIVNTDASKQSNTIIKLSKPNERSNTQVIKQPHLLVYQLPFNIRKDIPKFILNVHIYDQDPINRIAVLNGTKFVINDLIDNEVLVKDITQFGVLLDFNGTEFLIPKL